MNNTHRKTMQTLFADPVNGGVEWSRIEAPLLALDCRRIEDSRSSVTFEKDRVRAYFHRSHPRKDALRYRVKDARQFLLRPGVKP